MPDTENASEALKEPRIIKRYTNRKLYDTVRSKYVTLEEIAAMIKSGADIRVVDNQSKEDLTSVTLAQIIFEEEKAKRNRMPLHMLREIVRHGGESITEFISKEVTPRVTSIREGAEDLRDRLLKRDAAEKDGRPAARDTAKELVAASQRALEDLQRRIDERVRAVVDGLLGNLPALARDVQALEAKIGELESKLAEMEKR